MIDKPFIPRLQNLQNTSLESFSFQTTFETTVSHVQMLKNFLQVLFHSEEIEMTQSIFIRGENKIKIDLRCPIETCVRHLHSAIVQNVRHQIQTCYFLTNRRGWIRHRLFNAFTYLVCCFRMIDTKYHAVANFWTLRCHMSNEIFQSIPLTARNHLNSKSIPYKWTHEKRAKIITLSTECLYEFPVHLYLRWAPRACLVCRNSMVAASKSNRL